MCEYGEHSTWPMLVVVERYRCSATCLTKRSANEDYKDGGYSRAEVPIVAIVGSTAGSCCSDHRRCSLPGDDVYESLHLRAVSLEEGGIEVSRVHSIMASWQSPA